MDDELSHMFQKHDVGDLPMRKKTSPSPDSFSLGHDDEDSLVKISSRDTYTFRSDKKEDIESVPPKPIMEKRKPQRRPVKPTPPKKDAMKAAQKDYRKKFDQVAAKQNIDVSITISQKFEQKVARVEQEHNELEQLKDAFKQQLIGQIDEYKAKLKKINMKELDLRQKIADAEHKISSMDALMNSFTQPNTNDSVLRTPNRSLIQGSPSPDKHRTPLSQQSTLFKPDSPDKEDIIVHAQQMPMNPGNISEDYLSLLPKPLPYNLGSAGGSLMSSMASINPQEELDLIKPEPVPDDHEVPCFNLDLDTSQERKYLLKNYNSNDIANQMIQ